MNDGKNSLVSRVVTSKELDTIKSEANLKSGGIVRMTEVENSLSKAKKFKQFDLINSEADITALMRSIAKTTSIVASGIPMKKYQPIYKHPLPPSKHRYHHEAVLKRVMSCSLNKQANAAVISKDAYTLEEVFMRGAPVDLKNSLNGFSPLHLAVQGNDIDCVRMLLHIGVDINSVSSSGCTPLYLAGANQVEEIKLLLIENGARLYNERQHIHGTTILAYNAPNMRASALILPPVGSRRPTNMTNRHASY